MNNDLERLLNESPPQHRSAADPLLRVGPCVKGGLPLDEAPRLEVARSAGAQGAANHARHGLSDRQRSFLRPAAEIEGPYASAAPAHATTAAGRSAARGGCVPRLAATDLWKSYRKGPLEVPVLRGVNLTVGQGEFLTIVGQSGSGKSTLLHLLATLDAPDQGEISFDGHRIDDLAASGRDILRNRHFGMIFQFYHLLPELTTLENVLMPLMIAHDVWAFLRRRGKHRAAALDLLNRVGLGHRLKHKPRELSGGEMQRAAIARALVAQPELLLADEPTGNLDHETGGEIIKLLRDLNRQQNLTIVMVTHDPAIAHEADRIVRLVDGRIEG